MSIFCHANSKLLGVDLNRLTLEEISLRSIRAIENRSGTLTFVCLNPHSLVVAQKDREFREALNEADFAVVDGVGVSLVTRACRFASGPRITGHDYFTSMLQKLPEVGRGRVFFMGSSHKVLELIRKRFQKDHPDLELCGVYSPPYGEWSSLEDDAMVNAINAAKPDVLWVGMTAPKQEKWVYRNLHRLDVSVIGSIGAVFDFYAGTHPRAPQWLCNIGMEWLYRLCREPKRMWQRNFISSPVFLGMVLRQHILNAR